MPAAYVVRERTLSPHIRPNPLVYDVTEAHTRRPVPYGVHGCPDRAAAHADRLTRRAQQHAQTLARAEDLARDRDRDRIRQRRYHELLDRLRARTHTQTERG